MSVRRETRRIEPFLGAILAAGLLALSAPAAFGQSDPWAAKSQWFSVRGGYAKSTAPGAADGNLGFGFGYTRFRSTKWAFSGNAHVEILGHFGSAYEIEVPWTVDVARHFKWPAPVRPYLGVGAGIYYHQYSGTGDDASSILGGGYLLGGFNTPISEHNVLGVDVRMNVVEATGENNPVFGSRLMTDESQSSAVHWSVKLNYAWVF